MANRGSRSFVPFNWHPAVHTEHFGEQLYFIMLCLKEPLHEPVANQISTLLRSAGIEQACEYSIFGWWDALIRVWLCPVSYRRLLRTLDPEEPNNNVDELRGFTTSRIHYFWTGNDFDYLALDQEAIAAVAARSEDIDFTTNDPAHLEKAVWRRLRDAGLIFDRKPPKANSVKFYTTLERTDGGKPAREEIRAIVKAMIDSKMIGQASLYAGEGLLADYLVRCVADSYSDVLRLGAAFDVYLNETRLRPMTLLIANTDARESDHVNDKEPLSYQDNSVLDLPRTERCERLGEAPATRSAGATSPFGQGL